MTCPHCGAAGARDQLLLGRLRCDACGASTARAGGSLRELVTLSARFTGALVARRPIYTQLVVTRRCNLSCGYCSEYDQVSPAVPLDELRRRIDALHRLRAFHICMHGGEPLLHPDLAEVVAYAAKRSQVSLITNGLLLTDEIIDALNAAPLFAMQVSVDALAPDPTLYVQKSLKTLRGKLERLRARARFRIVVNLVLCERTRGEFRRMVDEIDAMGLPLTVGIMHDEHGAAAVTGEDYLALYRYYRERFQSPHAIEFGYGEALLRGEQPAWKCRAGARYLYVDEGGRVQLCPTQRGRIDKPVVDYTEADLRANYESEKGCEAGCSVMCAYRPSAIDNAPLATVRSVVAGLVKRSERRA
jgi:MoaA/NifB/PqqE/SkfB family radical SAM enzyme